MAEQIISYLGPAGTFTELAAVKFDAQADRISFRSVQEALTAVQEDRCGLAIIAIENIIHGIVRENLDYLYQTELKVQAEVILPIHHAISCLSKESKITEVVAHPQALAQCRSYLDKTYPHAARKAVSSNAAGMQEIVQKKLAHTAAIGPANAARQRNLYILEEQIEDKTNNITRFWVIGKELKIQPEHDKSSIAYYFKNDEPGCLYNSLGYFAEQGINLSSIAIRPSSRNMGNYIFHLDLLGNLNDPKVQTALDGLRSQVDILKILGSYQRAAYGS